MELELDWKGDELAERLPRELGQGLRAGVKDALPDVRRSLRRKSGRLRRALGISRLQANGGFWVGWSARWPFGRTWRGERSPSDTVRDELKPRLPGIAAAAIGRVRAKFER